MTLKWFKPNLVGAVAVANIAIISVCLAMCKAYKYPARPPQIIEIPITICAFPLGTYGAGGVYSDRALPPLWFVRPTIAVIANAYLWGWTAWLIRKLIRRYRNLITNGIQHGGPGYPPQGVGSPDP